MVGRWWFDELVPEKHSKHLLRSIKRLVGSALCQQNLGCFYRFVPYNSATRCRKSVHDSIKGAAYVKQAYSLLPKASISLVGKERDLR